MFRLTHVNVGFSLLLMPHSDVECLFGKVCGRGVVEDKLFPVVRLQGPPLGCRGITTVLATRMQEPIKTQCKTVSYFRLKRILRLQQKYAP